MFSFKAFLKFLGRNKLYTAINIFGFAASMTFVIMIGLYVQSEYSVDNNVSKADRIVLLRSDLHYQFPGKLAADIQGRYPEVEATMRHSTANLVVKKMGNSESSFGRVMQTDSTYFTMFDINFIEGSALDALADMQSVVLSESYARKLYGNESASGKQLEIDGRPYTVSGIVSDVKNSVIPPFDCIVRFETVAYQWEGYLTTYNSCMYPIIMLLKPGTSLEPKYGDMITWFKEFFWLYQRDHATQITTVPLRDTYWDEASTLRSNSRTFVEVLIACALAVLLFAVINYINLSTAQTTFRAKQAATRRLLGGTKMQLFVSFVFESVLLCLVSLLLGIYFSYGALGWFNDTLQTDIQIGWLFSPLNIFIMVGSVIVLGFVAGVIPAYIITRFKPISVVRGDFRRASKMVLSKILIGVQYFVTIVLLGCALTIGRQTSYMVNTDLGFERDQILRISNSLWNKKIFSVYDVLSDVPGVELVSLTAGTPTSGGNNNTMTVDGVNYSYTVFRVDSVGMKLLDIETVLQTGVVDSGAVWINQTAARKINFQPNDVQMPWYETHLPVRGIVKDFHTSSMAEQIGEVIIMDLGDEIPWDILVKINSTDPATTRERIEAKFTEFSGQPCESAFLDEDVEQWYTKQKQTQSLVGMISILAIIISALGILAMSTYFIGQRRREIAVRKVFGSSNGDIFFKLIKQFVIIIAISFVVAVPVIYYFMNDWLGGFAYHIDMSVDIFIIAGILAFLIAMTTISWKAYQAMVANPVKSLKAE